MFKGKIIVSSSCVYSAAVLFDAASERDYLHDFGVVDVAKGYWCLNFDWRFFFFHFHHFTIEINDFLF